jgi:hypothetical protein
VLWQRTAGAAFSWRRSVGKGKLNSLHQATVMRVAMAIVVALLVLNFVDKHFNQARYTKAAMAMLSQMTRSFS